MTDVFDQHCSKQEVRAIGENLADPGALAQDEKRLQDASKILVHYMTASSSVVASMCFGALVTQTAAPWALATGGVALVILVISAPLESDLWGWRKVGVKRWVLRAAGIRFLRAVEKHEDCFRRGGQVEQDSDPKPQE